MSQLVKDILIAIVFLTGLTGYICVNCTLVVRLPAYRPSLINLNRIAG